MDFSEIKPLTKEQDDIYTPAELEEMVIAAFQKALRSDDFIPNPLSSPLMRMEQFETFMVYMRDLVDLGKTDPPKRRQVQLQMCQDFLLTTYRLGYTSLAELQLDAYVALERELQRD